jgi:hypothetical protein
MKGIYLTEEGKKEIEAKIDEFESFGIITELHPKYSVWKTYKEILSSATILPVEDNWDEIRLLDGIDSSGIGNLTKAKYPNGVIIKSN